MRTSIIIRTKNEERWIGEVLKRLYEQTDKDFEVVVVDSGSTDSTLDIVSKHPVNLVQIPPEEFTYPHALNIGIRNSCAEKYVVLLSAHSLPTSNRWLESAVRILEHNPKVMGVYGQVLAMPDSTFWDKVFFGFAYVKERIKLFLKRYREIHEDSVGVLGFTNAIIRKELWEKYNFNEDFAGGGEDNDWVRHWFNDDYTVIKSIDFNVYHSHYLNLKQWREQIKFWQSLSKPTPFKTPFYRYIKKKEK